jgi:hypothetical protein
MQRLRRYEQTLMMQHMQKSTIVGDSIRIDSYLTQTNANTKVSPDTLVLCFYPLASGVIVTIANASGSGKEEFETNCFDKSSGGLFIPGGQHNVDSAHNEWVSWAQEQYSLSRRSFGLRDYPYSTGSFKVMTEWS